jgi:hypothetical protein
MTTSSTTTFENLCEELQFLINQVDGVTDQVQVELDRLYRVTSGGGSSNCDNYSSSALDRKQMCGSPCTPPLNRKEFLYRIHESRRRSWTVHGEPRMLNTK